MGRTADNKLRGFLSKIARKKIRECERIRPIAPTRHFDRDLDRWGGGPQKGIRTWGEFDHRDTGPVLLGGGERRTPIQMLDEQHAHEEMKIQGKAARTMEMPAEVSNWGEIALEEG